MPILFFAHTNGTHIVQWCGKWNVSQNVSPFRQLLLLSSWPKNSITSNIIQNGILRCVEETLREEKEPKKRVRRRWFCKIASFKWPHGWSFSTLLCSRVPGQMGRWPAILDSRRASFEKEWSKKGIFWRWPHHFWLLRNSCKSRKGKMCLLHER